MPACLLDDTCSAVSSAPHSVPFTQVTCCMRVSLLSSDADVSANGSAMRSSTVLHVLLFRHCRSGWLPDFCTARGGGAYTPTSSSVELSVKAGDPLIELVFVTAQTSSCVDGCAVLLPSPVSCASAAALELRNHSVPPDVASPPPPGVVDGHNVKPFSANPKVSSPCVSNCTTLTEPPASSWDLDIA